MKFLGIILLIVVALVVGFLAGDRLATQRMQAQVIKARGDAQIFQAETEKLSEVLRNIRQTAAQATVVEQAQ